MVGVGVGVGVGVVVGVGVGVVVGVGVAMSILDDLTLGEARALLRRLGLRAKGVRRESLRAFRQRRV